METGDLKATFFDADNGDYLRVSPANEQDLELTYVRGGGGFLEQMYVPAATFFDGIEHLRDALQRVGKNVGHSAEPA